MTILTKYEDIAQGQWRQLVELSPTGNWFQMPQAYDFWAEQPELFRPFVVYMPERAVCVGYITQEPNPIKQWVTKRAIIVGGPALAADCSNEEVTALMQAVIKLIGHEAIYVETRNLNDYSPWRKGFEDAGFEYEEHYNFHVETAPFKSKAGGLSGANGSVEQKNTVFVQGNNTPNNHRKDAPKAREKDAPKAQDNDALHACENDAPKAQGNEAPIAYEQVVPGLMHSSRVRDVKSSFRKGAMVIDRPSIEQVRAFYEILKQLYKTRVKTPLFPLSFFEKLYAHPDGRILLVGLQKMKEAGPSMDGDDESSSTEGNDEGVSTVVEIIGGQVCIEVKGRCLYEYFVAGKDGVWKGIHPSSVATYAGMRYAAEQAIPLFDMMGAGTPQVDYGVRDFKARFGGQLVEHGRYKMICNRLLYRCGEWGVKLLKKI